MEQEKTPKTLALVGALLLALAAIGYYGLPTMNTDGNNEPEPVADLIKINKPLPGAEVSGSVSVTGQARGAYFFEASFPVTLLDAEGKVLTATYAQAEGEWMTEEYVPFASTVAIPAGYSGPATLVLAKDNPSGLPEHDFSITIPLVVKSGSSGEAPGPTASGGCKISGCSAQICAEEEMASTCEYRESYACYRTAKCERQAGGKCGWTDTTELRQCLANAQ